MMEHEIERSERSERSERQRILNVVYGIGMNVNHLIGSGIVTSPGIVWGLVKSPGIVVLMWLMGGIVALSGSWSYVELGIRQSIISRRDRVIGSGGETKYLQIAYPKPKFMMSYLFSFMYIL